jgi:hypothetical protein
MTDSDFTGRRLTGRSIGKWFWGGFIVILVVGVLLAVFATIREGKQWLEATLGESDKLPISWTEVIQVTLSGTNTIFIDRAALPQIQSETQEWIGQRMNKSQRWFSVTLDHETEVIFQAASYNIPAFADWYYSLGGEYTRLLYAAFGNLPEYLFQQLDQRVFQPSGTAEAIDRLATTLDARLTEQLRIAALDMQKWLVRLVRAQQVSRDEVNVRIAGEWALGTQLAAHMETYVSLTSQDIARQSLATSAGVAASAITAKKLGAKAVAKVSTKLAGTKSLGALTTAAAKLGLKSAAKVGGTLGSAGAGATSSAAFCAGTLAGAPLAPGCALVGGALTGLAAWLLVDKAVLETEELLNREALEDELRQALVAQREELRMGLKTRYARAVHTGFQKILDEFDSKIRPTVTLPPKDFVPAQAAQGK